MLLVLLEVLLLQRSYQFCLAMKPSLCVFQRSWLKWQSRCISAILLWDRPRSCAQRQIWKHSWAQMATIIVSTSQGLLFCRCFVVSISEILSFVLFFKNIAFRCCRAMPPEHPSVCNHLPHAPQGVFFRLLRPELIQ